MCGQSLNQVRVYLERMGPAESGEDTDRELAGKKFARERVVMADSRDAAEKISNGPPPKADCPRDLSMASDQGGVGAMDSFAHSAEF